LDWRPPATAGPARSARAPGLGAGRVPFRAGTAGSRRHGALLGRARPLEAPGHGGSARRAGMIQVIGRPRPPVPRLMAALERRSQGVGTGGDQANAPPARDRVLVVGAGEDVSPDTLAVRARERGASSPRILVVSLLGA